MCGGKAGVRTLSLDATLINVNSAVHLIALTPAVPAPQLPPDPDWHQHVRTVGVEPRLHVPRGRGQGSR